MSIARGFGLNGQALYSNVAKPIEINLNFVVDSTNGNGLGQRSLKSNGYVRNVFLHTSASPGTNDGALNPNPAVGYALVQFKNNFNAYLGGFSGFASPVAGSATGTLVQHNPAIITTLGTTTLAQWQSAGLPLGLTPAVGQSFIAIKSGALGGTGMFISPGVSGITSLEVIGDPNESIANSNLAQNGGAYVLVQFLGATDASTTTLIAKAPADGSVVGMTFKFDGSSVTIDGL